MRTPPHDVPPMGHNPLGLSPTRRTLLRSGAAAVTLGGAGLGAVKALPGVVAQDATAVTTPTACVLTPEMTEGPYYLPLDLVRQDITEGTLGVPLQPRIAVQDVTACGPLGQSRQRAPWHYAASGEDHRSTPTMLGRGRKALTGRTPLPAH